MSEENTVGGASALPWSVEQWDSSRKRKAITIVSSRGVVCHVGDTSMPGAVEDAAYIVQAVNSHEKLVNTLLGLLECFEHNDPWPKSSRISAARSIRAALAHAGVKSND